MSIRIKLKRLAFLFASAFVWPFWVFVRLESRIWGSERAFGAGAQLFALMPGIPGIVMRAAYYYGTLERCHWEVNVGFASLFMHRGASMGRYVSTGCFCVIGHADIGEGTMIGSRVSIPSGKRQHLDFDGRLSKDIFNFERLKIGAGCWIGEGAIVMASIGNQCIVGAGSVVAINVPERTVISGNPAKTLKSLNSNL